MQQVTSSWFFLSTLNYDARSTTHQIYHKFHPAMSTWDFYYEGTHIGTAYIFRRVYNPSAALLTALVQ
jgi:hypothetical protein